MSAPIVKRLRLFSLGEGGAPLLDEAADTIEALLGALETSEAAIAEYYRYQTGGEMRGSYDGKPERGGLWAARQAARAAIAKARAQ